MDNWIDKRSQCRSAEKVGLPLEKNGPHSADDTASCLVAPFDAGGTIWATDPSLQETGDGV